MITHRFFQRLNWVLLALAVGFAVTGHGDLLFYLILTTPVLLLVMVAYNRVARGVGARPERVIGPDSPAPTGSILWAAVGGVVLIVVLMVAAPLIIYGHEDGNVLMLVAGFGLVSVFAGLALSPHLLRIGWFVTMRGLATFGRRREFYHGMLELASGRLSKAEHSFRRHLNRYPEDGCARTSLAVALLAQARREEALAEADLAADSDRRPEALYCHGSILAAIGDTARGAAEMEAALATKPRLPGGRLYFAMALIELRRLEAAIAVLATERSVWKNSLYYTVLGEANRLLGRADLAADAYVTAE